MRNEMNLRNRIQNIQYNKITTPPIKIEQIKNFLRIDHDEDDQMLL